MTYVELIVVLSIFSVLSSVAIFNYGDFQARVDIKNLASDIAIKIVEAQKASLGGALPLSFAQQSTDPNWKPSYGIHITSNATLDIAGANDKNFIYFTDIDSDKLFTGDGPNCNGECLDYISITKGEYIEKIEKVLGNAYTPIANTDALTITFTRPDASAVFSDSLGILSGFDYVKITLSSANQRVKASIRIYPSGRIQID